jgi:hypothetical protein
MADNRKTPSRLDGARVPGEGDITSRRNLQAGIGWIVLSVVFVSAIFVGTAEAGHIPTVDLGRAESFAVLAGQGVTNTGPTVIEGDVGSFPNTVVGGFPPGLVTNGTINPSYTPGAKDDLVTAFNDAAGRTPATPLGTELGGLTLTHGVYSSGTFGITGTLTLDAEGDPNAVWIFQAASTLITGVGSNVNLINGASECNIFWVVGSSADLGVNSTMRGTVMALTRISLFTGATLHGRALARNAAVTLDSNTILNRCGAPPPTEPTITTQVSSAQVVAGSSVTDTATISDLVASPTRGTLTFSAFGPNDPTCAGAPAYTSNAIPVTAVGNGTYTSAPAFVPTAAGTYLFRASYSGDPNNAAITTGCGDPNETVTVTPIPPSVNVTKTASPISLGEPGGSFTFTVGITNTSAAPVTISTINDDVFGNLAARPGSTCGGLIGSTLAGAAVATCTFTGSFIGNAGDTHTNRVTVTVTGTGGLTASDVDDATVNLTDVIPTIEVDKSASPIFRAEPGGDFTFTVVVTNTGLEPVTITSITDDVYGNLANLPGSDCGTGINRTLAASPGPNNTFTCTFTVSVIGTDGAFETDRVTVTAVDDEGNFATDFREATIFITAPVARRVIQPSTLFLFPDFVSRAVAPQPVQIQVPAVQTATPSPQAASPARQAEAVAAAPQARVLVRTGVDSLALLGLAFNTIVLGFLLTSAAASRWPRARRPS